MGFVFEPFVTTSQKKKHMTKRRRSKIHTIYRTFIGLNPQKTKCRNELHIIDFINTTKCKIDLIEIWNL